MLDAHSQANAELEKQILEQLGKLAELHFSAESSVGYHEGTTIDLPLHPAKMSKRQGAKVLSSEAAADEEETTLTHEFYYRFLDGCHALQLTLQRMYGIQGRGLAEYSMFGGRRPPQRRNIEVGFEKKTSVPIGRIELPMLDGWCMTTSWEDSDYGELFALAVTAPKEKEHFIQGFFRAVEQTLRTDSIYKGKAFTGTDEPKFIDVYTVDPNKIVYPRHLEGQLEDEIWGAIHRADLFRELDEPLGIKVVLDGDYGNGKSVGCAKTAQVAVEHGWTVLQVKIKEKTSEHDELEKTIRTGQLYSPAVVLVEDIDKALENTKDEQRLERMLELFDGISSKGKEVMVVMTSNHTSELPKAMLRVGRVDDIIEFVTPDRDALERLVKVYVPADQLDPDVDYDAVFEAVTGPTVDDCYTTSFVVGSFAKARRSAIVRTGSKVFKLNTEDLVRGAHQLRTQWDKHRGAEERTRRPTLESFFTTMVGSELDRRKVDFDNYGRLVLADQD